MNGVEHKCSSPVAVIPLVNRGGLAVNSNWRLTLRNPPATKIACGLHEHKILGACSWNAECVRLGVDRRRGASQTLKVRLAAD